MTFKEWIILEFHKAWAMRVRTGSIVSPEVDSTEFKKNPAMWHAADVLTTQHGIILKNLLHRFGMPDVVTAYSNMYERHPEQLYYIWVRIKFERADGIDAKEEVESLRKSPDKLLLVPVIQKKVADGIISVKPDNWVVENWRTEKEDGVEMVVARLKFKKMFGSPQEDEEEAETPQMTASQRIKKRMDFDPSMN